MIAKIYSVRKELTEEGNPTFVWTYLCDGPGNYKEIVKQYTPLNGADKNKLLLSNIKKLGLPERQIEKISQGFLQKAVGKKVEIEIGAGEGLTARLVGLCE